MAVEVTPKGLPPTTDQRCGTEAGERAHYRRNEKPCAACRKAANKAKSARAEARGWRAQEVGSWVKHCTNCGGFLDKEGMCHLCD